MKLSSKTRYGLTALVALARLPAGEAMQVRQLAEQEEVPARFLEQIFQDLRKAGLVSGRRGPKGGFRLRRPAEQVRLLDVVHALEGPLRLLPGAEEGERGGTENAEAVREALGAATERLSAALATPTLADLAAAAEERARHRRVPRRYTYVI